MDTAIRMVHVSNVHSAKVKFIAQRHVFGKHVSNIASRVSMLPMPTLVSFNSVATKATSTSSISRGYANGQSMSKKSGIRSFKLFRQLLTTLISQWCQADIVTNCTQLCYKYSGLPARCCDSVEPIVPGATKLLQALFLVCYLPGDLFSELAGCSYIMRSINKAANQRVLN